MGWLELLGWLGAMNRQLKGREPSPDSWAVEDPWFKQQRDAQAREARGQ